MEVFEVLSFLVLVIVVLVVLFKGGILITINHKNKKR